MTNALPYDHELAMARDAVWRRLALHPIRRAALGRDQADAITAMALGQMPDDVEMDVAGEGTDYERMLRERTERRVLDLYVERCGFAFTTFLLTWAISAIVQALIMRWWRKRQENKT
jgi:hypothetical protein